MRGRVGDATHLLSLAPIPAWDGPTRPLVGSGAISDWGQKDPFAVRIRLCGEPLELLSKGLRGSFCRIVR